MSACDDSAAAHRKAARSRQPWPAYSCEGKGLPYSTPGLLATDKQLQVVTLSITLPRQAECRAADFHFILDYYLALSAL